MTNAAAFLFLSPFRPSYQSGLCAKSGSAESTSCGDRTVRSGSTSLREITKLGVAGLPGGFAMTSRSPTIAIPSQPTTGGASKAPRMVL